MASPKGISAVLKNYTANKLLDIVNDESQPKRLRAAAEKELSTRSMRQDMPPKRMGKGGVTVLSIGIGKMPKKKLNAMGNGKAKMSSGGMAYGKAHMYVGGGEVKMNPGLKALKESGPKGREAYKKITGQNA